MDVMVPHFTNPPVDRSLRGYLTFPGDDFLFHKEVSPILAALLKSASKLEAPPAAIAAIIKDEKPLSVMMLRWIGIIVLEIADNTVIALDGSTTYKPNPVGQCSLLFKEVNHVFSLIVPDKWTVMGCTVSVVDYHYLSSQLSTKDVKKGNSGVGQREWGGSLPYILKGPLTLKMGGHSKSYSADELQLLAAYCKGALCDQNHHLHLSAIAIAVMGWDLAGCVSDEDEEKEG